MVVPFDIGTLYSTSELYTTTGIRITDFVKSRRYRPYSE